MVAESTVRFQGNLQVQDDPRNWIRAVMVLHPTKVDLSSGDQNLGSWPLSQVAASRLEGDRFELRLGEETAVFAADDALGFSYEALPRMNKKSMLGSIGKLFAAKRESEVASEGVTVAEPAKGGDGEVWTFTLRDVMATADDWDHAPATDEFDDVDVLTARPDSLDEEIAALELSVALADAPTDGDLFDFSPSDSEVLGANALDSTVEPERSADVEPLVEAPGLLTPAEPRVGLAAVAAAGPGEAPKPPAPIEPEPTERLHLALARLVEAVEQKKFPPQHLDRINDLIQSVAALMEATGR